MNCYQNNRERHKTKRNVSKLFNDYCKKSIEERDKANSEMLNTNIEKKNEF